MSLRKSSKRVASRRAAVWSAAAAAAIAGPAAAAVITTPSDLAPGAPFYVVFVTDGMRDATSTNIADYDTFVGNDAGATTYNGSNVTWSALGTIEGGVTAVSRFNPSAPIYRLDGTRVADNGADLWDGSIQNAVDISPSGAVLNTTVFTGMNSDGSEAKGLGGETNIISNEVLTTTSNSSASNFNWANANSGATPTLPQNFYGFSSQLTAIPEPASTASVAAAIALAAAAMRRRCAGRAR